MFYKKKNLNLIVNILYQDIILYSGKKTILAVEDYLVFDALTGDFTDQINCMEVFNKICLRSPNFIHSFRDVKKQNIHISSIRSFGGNKIESECRAYVISKKIFSKYKINSFTCK